MIKFQKSKALAGRVQRWHSFPVLHQQSVGEHTHRVATLFIELFGTPRVEVLVYILHHDLGEFYSGDSPFSAKREVPELKEASDLAEKVGLSKLGIELPSLTEEEWIKFKVADLLEMHEYAFLECRMGNTFAEIVLDNVENYIKNLDEKYCKIQTKALKWIEQNKVIFYE